MNDKRPIRRAVFAFGVLGACAVFWGFSAVGSAVAAPVRQCGFSGGGGFRNVTTRNVSCRKARPVVLRVLRDVRSCWASERRLGRCSYRRGVWRVRGRWFRDRYGNDQLDLRSTASHRRVVRFQTDWDGE